MHYTGKEEKEGEQCNNNIRKQSNWKRKIIMHFIIFEI